MARSLVVKVTAGADAPERCSQAFTVAATAVAAAIVVVLPFHSGMLIDYPTVPSPVPPVPVLTTLAVALTVPLQIAISVMFVLAPW